MVLAAILVKNRKNGQKWDFGPLYLKNSPRYDIDMSVVFDKVDDKEFESEDKTGNGSSFVCHFDEKPAKSFGVFSHICEVAPLSYFNAWQNFLQNFNYTSVVNKLRKLHGASPPLS